jgi:hypothetical protein
MTIADIEKVVKEHLIIWPESFESQIWNERLESLLAALQELDKKPVNERENDA